MARKRSINPFRHRPEPPPAPRPMIDLSDGRDFNPLDVADGHARIIISRVPVTVDGERKWGTSVDTVNIDKDFTLRLYRDAEDVVRGMDDAARAEKAGRTDG